MNLTAIYRQYIFVKGEGFSFKNFVSIIKTYRKDNCFTQTLRRGCATFCGIIFIRDISCVNIKQEIHEHWSFMRNHNPTVNLKPFIRLLLVTLKSRVHITKVERKFILQCGPYKTSISMLVFSQINEYLFCILQMTKMKIYERSNAR